MKTFVWYSMTKSACQEAAYRTESPINERQEFVFDANEEEKVLVRQAGGAVVCEDGHLHLKISYLHDESNDFSWSPVLADRLIETKDEMVVFIKSYKKKLDKSNQFLGIREQVERLFKHICVSSSFLQKAAYRAYTEENGDEYVRKFVDIARRIKEEADRNILSRIKGVPSTTYDLIEAAIDAPDLEYGKSALSKIFEEKAKISFEREEKRKAEADLMKKQAEWIEEHGSERLKLGLKNGYDMETELHRSIAEYLLGDICHNETDIFPGESSEEPFVESLCVLSLTKKSLEEKFPEELPFPDVEASCTIIEDPDGDEYVAVKVGNLKFTICEEV